MALLGPKDDVRRLATHLEDTVAELRAQAVIAPGAWAMEARVRVSGDAVVVDLKGLPPDPVKRLVDPVLMQIDSLWTRHLRIEVDAGPPMAELLSYLNAWSRDSRWRVSRREGTPYIDIRHKPRDATQDTANTGSTRVRQVHQLAPAAPAGPTAEPGADRVNDLAGLLLAVPLAMPTLLAFNAATTLAVQRLGVIEGALVGVRLVGVAFGLLFVAARYASYVVRPRWQHVCRSCGAVNRIQGVVRKQPLACGGCEKPIYGAWPIPASQPIRCAKCQTENTVPGELLRCGLPHCARCEQTLAVNPQMRKAR